MKTKIDLDSYIQEAQQLALLAKKDDSAKQRLLQLISEQIEAVHDAPALNEFFQGELEFYNSRHQQALKHYLQAKENPYFKICCYRASAYVSKSREDITKAITFANEALFLLPNDPSSLFILEELLRNNQQPEAAQNIHARIEALYQHPNPISDDNHKIFTKTTTTELAMHTPQGFLTSLDNQTNGATEQLTDRLYSLKQYAENHSPFTRTLEQVSYLEQPSSEQIDLLGHSEQADSLEQSIKSFQKRHEAGIAQYLEQLKSRPISKDYCLHILHGYPSATNLNTSEATLTAELLLADKELRTSGGYYIRWNGKGIAINPGTHFLEHFHRNGLHIRDIDYIIITSSNPETHSDIEEIYELNYQLNNANTELHVINYLICQKAYQTLSHSLKPHFKQERDSVRCLELFLDSPEVEKISLTDEIALHYFSTEGQATALQNSIPNEDSRPIPAHLGIRLDLTRPNDQSLIRLGFISGASWSPLLSHHLGSCEVLIAGFGSTNANDYRKLKYNETCLGYYGSYSLMEEVNPNLFISSEFKGNQGDIRLEVIKLMRQEYMQAYPNSCQSPAVLPADPTLFIDLLNLNVQCSITKTEVPPSRVKIMKSQAGFGNLRYLSPSCWA